MTDKTLDGKTYWYCEDCGRLCHGGPHDCQKITRKDAEDALRFLKEETVRSLKKRPLDIPAIVILRQCRIIEPGGLDAETLREAAKMVDEYFAPGPDWTCYAAQSIRARADAIEKGE